MILEILNAILGLAFGLFIPGFILNQILFKEQEMLERIALSIAFSISIDIFIGLFLGANLTMKNLTGGITVINVWISILLTTIILAVVYYLQKVLKK